MPNNFITFIVKDDYHNFVFIALLSQVHVWMKGLIGLTSLVNVAIYLLFECPCQSVSVNEMPFCYTHTSLFCTGLLMWRMKQFPQLNSRNKLYVCIKRFSVCSIYSAMTCLSHTTTHTRSWERIYHQVSNVRCTLVGNKIVDPSDVVGAAPVSAAPTTSSFST